MKKLILALTFIAAFTLPVFATNPHSPALLNVGNGCERFIVNYDANNDGTTTAVICTGYFQSKTQKTPVIYWGTTKRFTVLSLGGSWFCAFSTSNTDACGNGYYANFGDMTGNTNATFSVVPNWSGSGYDTILYAYGSGSSTYIYEWYTDGTNHFYPVYMGTGY